MANYINRFTRNICSDIMILEHMFLSNLIESGVFTMKKKHYIKSKFRFTIFLVFILTISIFYVSTLLGFDNAQSMTKPVYTEIQIESGDTLWALAKEYGPANTDPRRIIYKICLLNNITADSIYPGQAIDIPKQL